MSSDKQISEMAKDLENHTCMSEIEDIFEGIFEGRLEVVDKRSGDKLKKASEVAREIIDILKSAGIDEWRYPVIAELKKKYTEEMKKIKIGEWVYGKFDIPHCSECGYEPTEISPFCPMCNANMESEDTE